MFLRYYFTDELYKFIRTVKKAGIEELESFKSQEIFVCKEHEDGNILLVLVEISSLSYFRNT
jgi:hypothetical protein